MSVSGLPLSCYLVAFWMRMGHCHANVAASQQQPSGSAFGCPAENSVQGQAPPLSLRGLGGSGRRSLIAHRAILQCVRRQPGVRWKCYYCWIVLPIGRLLHGLEFCMCGHAPLRITLPLLPHSSCVSSMAGFLVIGYKPPVGPFSLFQLLSCVWGSLVLTLSASLQFPASSSSTPGSICASLVRSCAPHSRPDARRT